ncbi:hypothetical protein ACJZ2D_016592 [Fusarium nematophilum]
MIFLMAESMSTESRHGEQASSPSRGEGTSHLSCETCKRRKAKCDRILPRCTLCDKTSRPCAYPSIRMKPGPKLGSRQRNPRRTRINRYSKSHASQTSDPAPDSTGIDIASPSSIFPAAAFNNGTDCQMIENLGEQTPMPSANIPPYGGFLPPSPKTSDSDGSTDISNSLDMAATNFVRALNISWLMHPNHAPAVDISTNDSSALPDGFFVNLAGSQSLITQACETMEISVHDLQLLIDLYFDCMTSFSIFHQPSFGAKIQSIKNIKQLIALFASMFSFSARFYHNEHGAKERSNDSNLPTCEVFQKMALRFVDQSLDECEDEIPPLCLLQALSLCTFNHLIRGVKGKAWRLIGTCVRVAYEHRLHLIDYKMVVDTPTTEPDLKLWSAAEEKRRCWWAIWEMDVFASTIRRCPTAIDWSMNKTHLPVDDELWFRDQYCRSSFLDLKAGDRWKRLKESGNESPISWFIVMNSLMRDGQVFSRANLPGILPDIDPGNDIPTAGQEVQNAFRERFLAHDAKELSSIVSAIQLTVASLPESLMYKGEKLTFGDQENLRLSRTQGPRSERRRDCAKYGIFLMTQLARFMTFQQNAFNEVASGFVFTETPRAPSFGWTAKKPAESLATCEGLHNCLQAADDILAILRNSSESHTKWVNPFLASTVCLVTSVQVLRKVYDLPGVQENGTDSDYAFLRLVYHGFAQFWRTPLALQENLDLLQDRLSRKRTLTAEMEARCIKRRMAKIAQQRAARFGPETEDDMLRGPKVAQTATSEAAISEKGGGIGPSNTDPGQPANSSSSAGISPPYEPFLAQGWLLGECPIDLIDPWANLLSSDVGEQAGIVNTNEFDWDTAGLIAASGGHRVALS